ncbi:hypothetical protein KW796_02350 [Candidatus Parcubacteria bacterium]|nr:hypothetical protein [Candidatus Parcubacteria bacterium]
MLSQYDNLFKRVPKNIKRLTLILSAVVAILLAAMIMLLMQLQAYRTPALSAEEKLRSIISEVGEKVILPEGETPTVATISDPSKLRDQPFFAEAEKGDQILIYTTSKKAVLWRPSVHKVVEVSSLNIIPDSPAADR